MIGTCTGLSFYSSWNIWKQVLICNDLLHFWKRILQISYKQRIDEHPIVLVNDLNYLYELQQVKRTMDLALHLL